MSATNPNFTNPVAPSECTHTVALVAQTTANLILRFNVDKSRNQVLIFPSMSATIDNNAGVIGNGYALGTFPSAVWPGSAKSFVLNFVDTTTGVVYPQRVTVSTAGVAVLNPGTTVFPVSDTINITGGVGGYHLRDY